MFKMMGGLKVRERAVREEKRTELASQGVICHLVYQEYSSPALGFRERGLEGTKGNVPTTSCELPEGRETPRPGMIKMIKILCPGAHRHCVCNSVYEMLISLIYTSSLLREQGGVGSLDAGGPLR